MDKASSSSSSNEKKYKGVRKRKWGKYVSEIRLPNSRDRIWLGSYDAAEKAARAFDAALFCLRGERANFNFPDDPPDIPGGQSLAPADIQVVAQQYAVSKPEFRAVELEDTSPSSNSEGAGRIDSIDWSFLDMLDNGSGTGGNNAGSSVMDFGQLFPEPGEMFMQSRFTHDDIINYNGEEEEDGDRDGNGGDLPYFLWNF